MRRYISTFQVGVCNAPENIFKCYKGTRGMPRYSQAMKDVVGCEKPRVAAEQAQIRGCPNGETRPGLCRVTGR